MTNKKSTKRALLASIASLLLCFTMLIGTTYAWFTDSVTSASNVIKTGNLDIKLLMDTDVDGTYDDISDSTSPIFGEGSIAQNNNAATLWEPGKTQVAYLAIQNGGNLDLKYTVGLNVQNVSKDLYEVMEYAIVADADKDAPVTAWTSGNSVVEGTQSVSDDVALKVGETHYFALVIHMDEEAGSEYMDGQVNFDLTVLATQLNSESDAFDSDYDKDATYAFTANSAATLSAALANGGDVIIKGTITDSTLDAYSATRNVVTLFRPTQDATLSGGKIIMNNSEANWGFVVDAKNNVNVTVKDTAIEGSNNWNMHNIVEPGSKLTIENVEVSATGGNAVYVTGGGEAVLNNVTVEQDGLNAGAQPWAPTAVAASTGSTVTINSGTYVGNTYGVYIYSSGAKVTINGGTFKAPTVLKADAWGDGVVTSIVVNGGNFDGKIDTSNIGGNGVGVITINGGNFTNFSAIANAQRLVINGGTFDADPSAYAKGKVTDNGDGTWTVSGYEVSSATELVDAIAGGKVVTLTQDIDLGKIDLTDTITNDVVIDANGHKITTTESYGIEVTPGKNVTISNADVEMTKEGDYITYAAGFKIANGDYAGATIILRNCTITMANGDWAYAVNVPGSVKNLNLVIDNCTLEGAVAVQCWGDNNTITITNSELICNYTTNATYTSFCVSLQADGSTVSENNTLVIDNCEFKYSGVDNFDKEIYSVKDRGVGNTVTVTNCTYGEKVVAN
ncbi:MAG: hypothetical protein IJ011_07770 [Clostridia bacterium]|nr:hypothetical protein [Clostridia bacterium]